MSGAARTVSYRSVVAHREFGALFAAHLLSLLGDRIATVAVSVVVFERSGSVLLTAATYATSLLPWLLGAPFLAALVDRWPRRAVLVTCDLVRCGLVLLLAVPGVPLPGLLLVLTAVAWLGPAFEAARAATLPLVLPTEQEYVAGSALTIMSNQVSQVAGLAGGGLLLTVVTTEQALLLDSATFAVSALLIGLFLARRPAVLDTTQPKAGLIRQVVDGARFTFTDPLLRSVLLLAWLVAAVTVLPEGLAVARASELGAPSWVTGVLMAAIPTGAAIGAVVLGRVRPETRARSMLPLSAMAFLGLAFSALIESWPVLFLVWVVVGVGAAVQLPASAMFMRAVPDVLRSRAFGLAQTGLMAGQGLALLVAGAGAELLGIPVLLLTAGGVGLLGLAPLVRTWPLQRQTSWSRPSRVDVWIAVVTVLAAASVALELRWLGTRSSPWVVSPWVVAAAFLATGSYVASIRIGRQAHVFSLDDIPRLIGLVFLSPASLIAARLGGAFLALFLVRRQRGRKLLFNLSSFALEVSVALAVFRLLDPGSGIGPSVWPAAIAATLLADLVSAWTVGVVIGLAEHDLRVRRVLRPDRMALGTALGAASGGMIAATTLWYAPSSAALIVVLVVLGMLGLRAFAQLAAEGREQQRLQTVLSDLSNLEATTPSLLRCLETIRELLAVEVVECWGAPTGGDALLSGWFTVRAPGSRVEPAHAQRDHLAARALAEHAGTWAVITDPTPASRWRRRRGSSALQHLAIVLPGPRAEGTRDPGDALAVLVATEPIGANRVFLPTDVTLMQTIGDLLGQALLRVEQRAQLLLTATQDPLTGLATLSEFRRLFEPMLDSGQRVGLLMVNLSRLRSVNDVFGRNSGDLVIAAAAERARDAAPDGSILGRVSGHHFACAFPLEHAGGVMQTARRLRAELERPLAAGGVQADLGVHIGVSLAPQHGADPDVLLRRAETAGDAAKDDPFGVAMFVHDLEQDVARPLRLVRDLRRALETPGELTLHYQPKQSLLTGDVYGCEALLRWTHPELGPVGPDEFIELAESTGLIGDITTFTLHEALEQSSRWTAQGFPGAVAVNLSARTLLDSNLVSRVAAALDRYGVEPALLTLEITETSVMAQPLRSVLMLDALSELGVQLSIDDFGTGYSNLVYLRQLPVQEVKLDRVFLSPLRGEVPLSQGGARAFEFLRHAIALVHSLGLNVVVEGVEDKPSLDALVTLGADSVQGYFICRPLPAWEVTAWMAALRHRAAAPD